MYNQNQFEEMFKFIFPIKKYTYQEQLEQVRLAKSGDEKAMEKLIKSNAGFIIKTINKLNTYRPLKSEWGPACMGFMEAVKRFDLTADAKLLTYAIWWIRAYVYKERVEYGAINLPVTYITKMKNQGVIDSVNGDCVCVSFDAEIFRDGNGKTLIDNMVFECEQEDFLEKEALLRLVKDQKKRYADILIYRWGLNDGEKKTLKDVGDKFHMTRERVRQIERKFMTQAKKKAHEIFKKS